MSQNVPGHQIIAITPVGARRRTVLNSSCAVSALLVMPAAISVGVMLAGPARAQTTLPSASSTVSLSNYDSGNPFSITSGTTIAADSGNGVYGASSGNWTLSNAGTVETSGQTGISFANGGTISNTGLIAGGPNNFTDYGVLISTGAASIINSGTITGHSGAEITGGGVITNAASGQINGYILGIFLATNGGTVENSGTISEASTLGFAAGLAMDGGYLSNSSSGLVTGAANGITVNQSAGSVYNAGTISATDGDANGIRFTVAGSVANDGTITSGHFGIDLIAGGSISNGMSDAPSVIYGDSVGIVIVGTTTALVHNGSEGTIGGGLFGIQSDSALTSISNTGTIMATGTDNAQAISLGLGGYVANLPGGTITGVFGITSDSGNATIKNGGLIAGTSETGVSLNLKNANSGFVANYLGGTITGASDGIFMNNGAGRVVNYGAVIGGNSVGGDFGIYLAGSAGYVLNKGLVSGHTGIRLFDGGTIINEYGSILGAKNAISISGNGAYVFNSANDGDAPAGYISGAVTGVLISSANGSVNNAGTIIGNNVDGTVATGVYLTDGGSVTNQSPGSIMAYSYGVQIKGAAGTIDNSGMIDAFGNGSSGIGILLASGGYVSAASGGTIYGGSIGVDFSNGGTLANAGSIGGGHYGVYITSGAGTLTNTGTITSNHTGAFINRNGSVTNSGLIEGIDEGLYIYGQSFMNITNHAGGTITGARGLETHYTATLDNAGLIAGTSGLGMYLAGGGLLTNESTGTISGTDAAIRANFAPQTLQNAGLISSSNNSGIEFLNGGAITNSLSGSIQGNQDGINDLDGVVLVNNSGTISGGSIGVAFAPLGTIVNAGSIGGGTYGVSLGGGGSLDNHGAIYGAEGAALSQGGVVLNDGAVQGETTGIAIAGSYASVSNQDAGTIQGGNLGLLVSSDTFSLTNAETIETAGYEAVRVIDGAEASASNASTGTISGGDYGIGLNDGSDTLINSGLIEANDAVFLAGSYASVTNDATGTLTGGFGIEGFVGTLNLQNSGLIDAGSGSNGIVIAGTLVSIENANSGTIQGGDYGVSLRATNGSVMNSGTIIGQTDAGIALSAGGSIENLDSGGVIGTIAGGQAGIGGDSAAVTLMNDGLVTGGNFGVSLGSGGTIANSAAGTISSTDVGIYGQNVTIQNAGLVTGTNSAGIVLEGGALANLAGATINGGDVGLILGSGASASNAGLISDSALPSHFGAELARGAALTNLAGGIVTGGTGVVIAGDNGTLFNAGTIIGTDGTAIAVGPNLDPAQITLTTGSTEIGTIDGGGTDGQIFLTGNNTLANTISNFGAGSALDIVTEADWNAIGDWTVANVTNDGTFQPGILGTPLRLTGNFVQTSGATLQVVVTPTVSSQFIITGTAKLAGKLTYAFAPGTYTPHIYSFLTATGGVTGEFTGVSYNGSVPPVLTHVTQGVSTAANLVLADTTPTPPPVNPPPVKPPPIKPPPTPPEIVAPLDGSIFADAAQAAAALAQAANSALLDHVSDAVMDSELPFAGAGFADENASPFGNGYENGLIGPNTGAGTPGADGVEGAGAPDGFTWLTGRHGAAGTGTGSGTGNATGAPGSANGVCGGERNPTPDAATSTAGRMTNAIAAAFCGAGGWMEAAGTTLNVNGNADATNYHADDGGFLAGVDRQVAPAGTRLGIAVGYDEAWLHDDAGGKATIDTTRVGLYGAQPLGRFTLAGDILAGFANTTTTRETGVGAAAASHSGVDYAGAVQIGTQLGYRGFVLRPAAGIRFASVTNTGFAESGGGFVPDFAIRGAAGNYNSVQPFIKAGVTRTFYTPAFVAITPSVSVGYDYEAGDRGRSVTVTAPDHTRFATGFANVAPSSAELSAGISAGKGNWSLYAHYSAYLAGNWTAQTGEAGLQVKF